jgi:hypothetical protein
MTVVVANSDTVMNIDYSMIFFIENRHDLIASNDMCLEVVD